MNLKYIFSISHPKYHRRQKSCSKGRYTSLSIPNQGEHLVLDYRKNKTVLTQSHTSWIKVLSWNIEMGYRLGDVTAELKHIAPDVILLQEVDIFNDSSFFDPFSKTKDLTFTNCFVAAKLDWIMVNDLNIISKSIGKGSQSDHQWVMCNISR